MMSNWQVVAADGNFCVKYGNLVQYVQTCIDPHNFNLLHCYIEDNKGYIEQRYWNRMYLCPVNFLLTAAIQQ